MKKILFNKLFLDVTKFFLLISLSLSLIIWVVQAVNFLDYISEDGHGIKTYFLITALNLPKIFSRIIPFCIFLATFYIINRYETKNELLIFWNIGIKKIRFINNLIYLSIFFLLIQIVLNAFITEGMGPLGSFELLNRRFNISLHPPHAGHMPKAASVNPIYDSICA